MSSIAEFDGEISNFPPEETVAQSLAEPWKDEDFFRDHAGMSDAKLSAMYGGGKTSWHKFRKEFDIGRFDTYNSPDRPSNESITKFLARGRTLEELVSKGFTLEDVRSVEGYDLFETRTHNYELVYLLLPKIAPVERQPKIWSYRWAQDVDGTRQPYLMIQMPDTDWEKIKVVPLADVHYGASACMVDKLREYVNWIASRDEIFCILPGDLFENSHGDSNKGISMYEQEIRPRSQVEDMLEILSPIAHKILWALPGNHEDRSRVRDYDPLEYLCKMLDIPYSYEPVFSDVLWKGQVFSFHTQHGKAGGQTKGGKMNAAARPQEMQEFVMFTIMAHVHDGDVSRTTRICRDRRNFRLVFKKQYIIICPAFYGYFNSYASKAGYKPGSYGSINMDLYANGDFHANS